MQPILQIIWKRRWFILATALLLTLVVGVRTSRERPVYLAQGTLEIEMPNENSVGIQDFFPSSYVLPSYLQTQTSIMTSTSLVGQAVDELSPAGPSGPATRESRQSAEQDFQSRLSVKVLEGSHLLQVSFRSEDSTMAAKAVNALMSIYVMQIQANRFESANEASGWVANQIKVAKTKLDESMDKLREYERAHELLTINPDRERLMNLDADRLQNLQLELTKVKSRRFEKEAAYRRILAGDTQLLQSGVMEEDLKKQSALQWEAAQLAKKFGPNFPAVQRNQEELAEVERTLAAEKDRLTREAESELLAAQQEESLINGETEEQRKKILGGSDQFLQENILKRDVDLNEQAYEGLVVKLQDATARASLKTATAKIIDPAVAPSVSSHPGLARNMFGGLLCGLILGIVVSIALNFRRDTINTMGDVESDLNLPLLGVVPAVEKFKTSSNYVAVLNRFDMRRKSGGSNRRSRPIERFRLDRDGPSHSQLADAISNLRASLLFALRAHKPHAIVFSSPLPSEGKTTISSNLAISLTQIGKKVLIVDGDLRRPYLHKVFSVLDRVGLAEYLQGKCDLNQVIQSAGVPGLDIIVCGESPKNPAELLSSERMRKLIQETKLHYDFVLVDSPTLQNMADTRVLASVVDGVVLIFSSHATPRFNAKQACANVRSTDCRIIGAVLNHMESGDAYYSYSYAPAFQSKEA